MWDFFICFAYSFFFFASVHFFYDTCFARLLTTELLHQHLFSSFQFSSITSLPPSYISMHQPTGQPNKCEVPSFLSLKGYNNMYITTHVALA